LNYQVRLEAYEGPLDLLLKLVERQEIAVASISVCQIISQFVDYFTSHDFTDVDEGSRFLVLAATLLAVKAQLILPRPDDEGQAVEESALDEEQDLEFGDHLLSYLEFREVAVALEQRAQDWQLHYHRSAQNLTMVVQARPVKHDDLGRLVKAFQSVLERSAEPDPYEVRVASLNLWDVMDSVLIRVSAVSEGLAFTLLFQPDSARQDIIVTFLAILELVYRGQVHLVQEEQSGEIVLVATGSKEKWEDD
jgi:segregation and condensation protein A